MKITNAIMIIKSETDVYVYDCTVDDDHDQILYTSESSENFYVQKDDVTPVRLIHDELLTRANNVMLNNDNVLEGLNHQTIAVVELSINLHNGVSPVRYSGYILANNYNFNY